MYRSTWLRSPSRCTVRRAVVRSPVAVKCCFMAASPSLSMSAKCPYRTLGVRYDANEEEIKGAFRTKAKCIHPDVSKDPLAGDAFKECKDACQFLLNAEKRAKYDKTLLPRVSSQALSYLNACSAQRHGISTRVNPRVSHREARMNLLKILTQIQACTKHIERVYVAPDILRGLNPATAARMQRSAGVDSANHSDVVTESDCGEHECCEPWIFYVSQQTEDVKTATATSSSTTRRN